MYFVKEMKPNGYTDLETNQIIKQLSFRQVEVEEKRLKQKRMFEVSQLHVGTVICTTERRLKLFSWKIVLPF